ncbi:MAG: coniferyl aldehyde dehydrogenase [bacterium]|nr:coniferyl aldehyde dehydrogenase [bacterium]
MKATSPAQLEQLFWQQKKAFEADRYPKLKERAKNLRLLIQLLKENHLALEAAISADFGQRSATEIRISEVLVSVEGLRHALKQLRSWMLPQERSSSIWFYFNRNQVLYQPLGVVGVIVPWNYPLYLALGPLTGALAAGNRVMVKLPEQTPRFSELLAQLLARYYSEDQIACVIGGPDVGAAFASLPFDHLLFTGSTKVGKMVMSAAAKNLTPLTLELGGKSPALVTSAADLKKAAQRILNGKLLNAGQTCVAPDYVLVPTAQREAFLQCLRTAAEEMIPEVEPNPQYTSLISPAAFERMKELYTEAMSLGASEFRLVRGPIFYEQQRKVAPVVLADVPPEAALLKEEIFGPLLPVIGYQNLQEAIDYVNARPRPLALYVFTKKSREAQRVLRSTHSGGAAINHCLMQIAQDDLPFGGVGASGMGRYHGREGFLSFSHDKSVYHQSALDLMGPFYPPYGRWTHRFIGWILRFGKSLSE